MRFASATVSGARAVVRGLLATERGLLVAALAGAAILPLIETVGRSVGHLHVPGSSSYVQQLTLWLCFLGGLITTRAGRHLTLSTAEFIKSERARAVTRVATRSLAAAVTGILAFAALQVVLQNRETPHMLPGGLPQWVSECIMPLALVGMALSFAWGASAGWRGRAVALATVAAAFALGLVPDALVARTWPLTLVVLAAGLLGAPIFVVIGGIALVLFFHDGTPVAAVSAEVYRLISSPTLPALPLLTACGYVLAEGGASTRLLRFFRALFGWVPGGMAIIVAGVCALFTTFTGGSGVTIIAVGGLLYPMLKEDNYPEGFSLGLVTASGSLGLLFPPSLPVILYAVVASAAGHTVPADSLYLAGLLPGLLMIALLAAYGVATGRRVQRQRQQFAWRELGIATWQARWELLLPAFIVWLFASGRTSMVETAAAALVVAVVTQCLLSRDLPFRRLPKALLDAGSLMGAVLILLAVAMGLTSYMVDAMIADRLLDWAQGHIHSQLVFLLALNVLLLVVGCLADIYSAIVIVVPLIAPIGAAFGVDPIHLGIIFLANLELGYLTPPVGMNLFLSSSRFDFPLMRVYRHTFPFLLILAVGVLLITYVPDMSLGLLRLLGRAGTALPLP
jgi:C4-dicarboxylate transporter DctM subunit